jgi:hypothetical protein
VSDDAYFLRFLVRFADSLTVVLGFALTVLCFTNFPVIADRPLLPGVLALPATIRSSTFRGDDGGLD